MGSERDHPQVTGASDARQRRRVVRYTACPECRNWSVGVLNTGRIVRHSRDFGSVEKVGPGTRHPQWITSICPGSGKKVTP